MLTDIVKTSHAMIKAFENTNTDTITNRYDSVSNNNNNSGGNNVVNVDNNCNTSIQLPSSLHFINPHQSYYVQGWINSNFNTGANNINRYTTNYDYDNKINGGNDVKGGGGGDGGGK